MTCPGARPFLPSSSYSSSSHLISFLILCLLTTLTPSTNAFYLPGLAPVNYCEPNAAPGANPVSTDAKRNSAGNKCISDIPVFVNRLDSVESVLPYEYTHFDFCESKSDRPASENLGQVIFGERIHSSPYNFTFKKSERCKPVCSKTYDPTKKEDKAKLDFMRKGILLNYQHHWIVDNMPVTWCYEAEGGDRYCATGMGLLMRMPLF